jgi:hypothetical protein
MNEVLMYLTLAGTGVAIIGTIYNIITSRKTITAEHDDAVRENERMKIRMESVESKTLKNETDILSMINREHQRDILLSNMKQTLDTVLITVNAMSKKLDDHLENHNAR